MSVSIDLPQPLQRRGVLRLLKTTPPLEFVPNFNQEEKENDS
jgi:hypothetical protein